MNKRQWITWKRRAATLPEHVSTYPADVWLIRKMGRFDHAQPGETWKLLRAANDLDPYAEIGRYKTLDQAKQAANDWMPA